LNYSFAAIFTLEAIVKIIGLGLLYFKDGWNVFDFSIVVGTHFGILISQVSTFNVGATATIIRAFRIFRVFRLIKRAKRLRLIFNTLVSSLPAIVNVGGLLLLFLYMFAITSINLFAEVKMQEPLIPTANFASFGISFLMLIRIITGENWHLLLDAVSRGKSLTFDCIKNPTYQDYKDAGKNTVGCGVAEAYPFFLLYLLIIQHIFMNLFVAIVLMAYDDNKKINKKTINQESAEKFRDVWSEFDPQGKGMIKATDLPDFLYKLGPKLGFDRRTRDLKAL